MRKLLAGLLCLTACSSPTDRDLILLQQPKTQQTVECRAHSLNVKMYTDVENCAKAYEAAGYTRVSSYKN